MRFLYIIKIKVSNKFVSKFSCISNKLASLFKRYKYYPLGLKNELILNPSLIVSDNFTFFRCPKADIVKNEKIITTKFLILVCF